MSRNDNDISGSATALAKFSKTMFLRVRKKYRDQNATKLTLLRAGLLALELMPDADAERLINKARKPGC